MEFVRHLKSELDPGWAPLKNQQGFKELLGKYEANYSLKP